MVTLFWKSDHCSSMCFFLLLPKGSVNSTDYFKSKHLILKKCKRTQESIDKRKFSRVKDVKGSSAWQERAVRSRFWKISFSVVNDGKFSKVKNICSLNSLQKSLLYHIIFFITHITFLNILYITQYKKKK